MATVTNLFLLNTTVNVSELYFYRLKLNNPVPVVGNYVSFISLRRPPNPKISF